MHITYLDLLPIDIQGANSKVDPYRVLLLLNEYSGLEPLDHTGFSDIRITNQDDFKEKVKRVLSLQFVRLHSEGRNVQLNTLSLEEQTCATEPVPFKLCK